MSWDDFWPTVAGDVSQADHHDARRLVVRLLAILTTGNTDGMDPAGDGEPWDLADEPPAVPVLSDSETAARCLWRPEMEPAR